MSLYASAQSSNRIPAPAGAHLGRCYGVIDLGTHINPQNGKGSRKILLQFELPTELHTFREEKGPEPFVVSREFGLSLSEKSHLRPFLEGWRGRPFTPEELAKFDVMVLAGLPCFINIIHNQKGDKTYANIASVMTVPKGMKIPSEKEYPANKVVTLSLNEEYNHDAFQCLPDWIQKKIQDSPEYRSIVNDSPSKSQYQESSGGSQGGLEDDDIPFKQPHYLTVGGW